MSSRHASIVLLSLACIGSAGCPGDDVGSASETESSTGSDDGSTGPGSTSMVTGDPTSGMTATSTGTTAASTSTTDPTETGTTDPTGTDTSTSGTTVAESSSETTAAPMPEIEVSIDAMATASGDAYDFADTVDVGALGTAATVTIDNVGTGDLNIAGVTVSTGDIGEFTLDIAMLDAVVAAGANTTFTVAFSPTNGGLKGATVSIDNDDADESSYELNLAAHTTANTYRDLMPDGSPSGRFNGQLAELGDGRLLYFGGRDAMNTWLGDTWVYDVAANSWTELAPATPPSARDTYAMAYAGGGIVILHGGNNGSGGGAGTLGDTWMFDAATDEWSPLMPVVAPAPRFQHRMIAIAPDTLLLYGGRNAAGGEANVSGTWIYDVVANTWLDVAPVADPGPRSAFALASDGMGTAWLHGGFNNFDDIDDTWTYDAVGNTWSVGMPITTPGGRAALHGGAFADGSFIVYSGKANDCCTDPSPGTFAYDPVADDWTDLAPPTEPAARFNYAFVALPGTNKAIIFGGLLQNVGAGTAQQQTWEYVGPRP